MTNITHKRTKMGNKSQVTLQPIEMHSASAAGRRKISSCFAFCPAEQEDQNPSTIGTTISGAMM